MRQLHPSSWNACWSDNQSRTLSRSFCPFSLCLRLRFLKFAQIECQDCFGVSDHLNESDSSLFSLFYLCLSWPVQWWSPWRWQRQWSDLRSLTEMPLGFAEYVVTRQLAFTSMQWHVRAAKGFSGRSYLMGLSFYILKWWRCNVFYLQSILHELDFSCWSMKH